MTTELGPGPLTYQPEIWRVEKDTIYAAIPAVESGLEYARECLSKHERELGRTTLKNKTWAETMEKDIRHMERTLEMLRACGPNDGGERMTGSAPQANECKKDVIRSTDLFDDENASSDEREWITCWECDGDGIDPATGGTCWRCNGKGECLEP